MVKEDDWLCSLISTRGCWSISLPLRLLRLVPHLPPLSSSSCSGTCSSSFLLYINNYRPSSPRSVFPSFPSCISCVLLHRGLIFLPFPHTFPNTVPCPLLSVHRLSQTYTDAQSTFPPNNEPVNLRGRRIARDRITRPDHSPIAEPCEVPRNDVGSHLVDEWGSEISRVQDVGETFGVLASHSSYGGRDPGGRSRDRSEIKSRALVVFFESRSRQSRGHRDGIHIPRSRGSA
jgi:hypothetical protein